MNDDKLRLTLSIDEKRMTSGGFSALTMDNISRVLWHNSVTGDIALSRLDPQQNLPEIHAIRRIRLARNRSVFVC